MEGRLTPVLKMTKPATSSRLDAGVVNGHVRTINRDLDLIDAAIGALGGGGGGGPPSGPAGGDLTGTYPNPTIAAGAVGPAEVAGGTYAISVSGNAATATTALGAPPTGAAGGSLNGTYPAPGIANGAVTDAQVAAANKDGTAGTSSMRTLGTGAQQAAAGNHTHAGAMTNPMTSPEDIIKGGASGAPTRLGVGSNGQVLTVTGGVVGWAAAAGGGIPASIVDAKGDLIAGTNADAVARVPVGADGTVLTADFGAAAGVSWAAPASVANLLTNGGFEQWQRGTGPFTTVNLYAADRWVLGQQGSSTLSVSRDSANADTGSRYCAACTYTHNAESYFSQKLEDYVQLRGRLLTFSVRVRCANAGAVRVAVYDSVNGYGYSAHHTGSGAYETLSRTVMSTAATTQIQVAVVFNASCTAYLDNATLVVGATAAPYVPLHPADDLARCQRYYAEVGGLAAYELVAPAAVHSATTGVVVLRFPVEMALTPTVVVSSPAHWACYSNNGTVVPLTALAVTVAQARSAGFSFTVASGLVAGNASQLLSNNTTAARITFTANP